MRENKITYPYIECCRILDDDEDIDKREYLSPDQIEEAIGYVESHCDDEENPDTHEMLSGYAEASWRTENNPPVRLLWMNGYGDYGSECGPDVDVPKNILEIVKEYLEEKDKM